MTTLKSSGPVQAEDDNMPLSIRRTRRNNRRLPKRFRDMLPEHPLPLPPQDAEVSLEFNPPQATDSSSATTSTLTPDGQPSPQADSSAEFAQVPSKRHAVLTTGKNSFGVFRLYDEDSIPSINDPEDQGRADPLPMPASQPIPGSMNPFYPYPNENSWRIGDWYWNRGAQKSQQSFKGLVEILTSVDFRTQDLHHVNWIAIDRQLGSHEPSQAIPDSGEWQTEDGGWMRRNITISVPFSRRSLHPGLKNYTILNFYHRCLLSIIHEVLSDPIRCKSFRFEPYSLRWKRSSGADDVGVFGELFSSEAFLTAHRDLQDAHLDSTSCTLPRRIVALMFWSDATQLTAFGDAKLWPLYVHFGNESKYQRCAPSANHCSHAAYFQTVCVSCFVVIQIHLFIFNLAT